MCCLDYVFVSEDTSVFDVEVNKVHSYFPSDPFSIADVGTSHLKSILSLFPSIASAPNLTPLTQLTHRGFIGTRKGITKVNSHMIIVMEMYLWDVGSCSHQMLASGRGTYSYYIYRRT